MATPRELGNLGDAAGSTAPTTNANFDVGTFFVDGVNNRVGVGTTAPVGRLHVRGQYARFGDSTGLETFQGVNILNSANSAAAETVSFLDVSNNLGTTDAHVFFGHQTNGGSYIRFGTTPAGDRASDRRAERMTIGGSDGHIRMGPYAGSTSTGNQTGLEIMNNGGTGDGNVAAISFHCTGTYGMHMHLRNDGIFGVGGWSASAWRWYVNMGNGDMIAAGNVTAYSDPRLKEDIEKIQSPIERLKTLNGVRFKWKQNSILGHPGEYDYGVLANEVQEAFPEIVTDSIHDSPDGDKYKAVAYDKLVPVLIEAFKEQQKQIELLKQEIQELKR